MINGDLKVLICEDCKIALAPAKIQEHIKGKHPCSGKFKIDKIQLDVICKKCGIGTTIPTVDPQEDYIEYLRLGLHAGVGCGLCYQVCATVGSLQQHYKNMIDHIYFHNGP